MPLTGDSALLHHAHRAVKKKGRDLVPPGTLMNRFTHDATEYYLLCGYIPLLLWCVPSLQ